MRIRGPAIVVAALALGSVAVAAVSSIDAPAEVDRVASRAAPPFRPEQTPEERVAAEVFELVNDERASRSLPPLQSNELVVAAATAHADDMAARRQMVHLGIDGTDAGDRLARAGFAWRDWGEAIGAGFGTPQLIVDAWMSDDVNRAHILGGQVHLGVGVAASDDDVPYWVLLVAT